MTCNDVSVDFEIVRATLPGAEPLCFGFARYRTMVRRALGGEGSVAVVAQDPEAARRKAVRMGLDPAQLQWPPLEAVDAEGAGLVRIEEVRGLPPQERLRLGVGSGRSAIRNGACPFLAAYDRKVSELLHEGFFVILAGVDGFATLGPIREHLRSDPDRWAFAPDAASAEALAFDRATTRVAVVAKSTQTQVSFDAIVCALLPKVRDLRVCNMICVDVAPRFEEARALAIGCDVLVIVGRNPMAVELTQRALAVNPRTHLVNHADELQAGWFADVRRVGLIGSNSEGSVVLDGIAAALADLGRQLHERRRDRLFAPPKTGCEP